MVVVLLVPLVAVGGFEEQCVTQDETCAGPCSTEGQQNREHALCWSLKWASREYCHWLGMHGLRKPPPLGVEMRREPGTFFRSCI